MKTASNPNQLTSVARLMRTLQENTALQPTDPETKKFTRRLARLGSYAVGGCEGDGIRRFGLERIAPLEYGGRSYADVQVEIVDPDVAIGDLARIVLYYEIADPGDDTYRRASGTVSRADGRVTWQHSSTSTGAMNEWLHHAPLTHNYGTEAPISEPMSQEADRILASAVDGMCIELNRSH